MFRKRFGTAGIRGQLYETKLLSLLLFRAQHNNNIEEFYLATNMDDIGAFDDICLRIKVKGHSRPVAIFIQAKHRENDDKVLTLNNKNNLAKYFQSFMKIKSKFNTNSIDKFFDSKYEETECVFVLYTNEKGNDFQGNSIEIVNDLISTGSWGSQARYSNEDEDFLCKIALKVEIRELATRFTKFMYNKKNDMNDDLILRYHPILARQVITVSDIQPNGHRIAKFRKDFFKTKDDYLVLFREKIFEEVLIKHVDIKKNKNIDDELIQNLLSSLFAEPSEISLGDLITENIITYKNGRLHFVDKVPVNLLQQLNKLNISQAKIDDSITRAGTKILTIYEFQVPAAFGNKDLIAKNEKRINHLANTLLEVIQKSAPGKVIKIDETTVDEGILKLNGGLGSAVGNILQYDEDTKLYMFNDNFITLENKSESLSQKLQSKIKNLEEYRLDVRVKQFPKLAFNSNDEINKNLAKEFFSKLVFYTNQEDESGVGQMLKQEIDDHESADTKSFGVKADAIFLNFHEEIQKWWMLPKQAEYLTKNSDLYQTAKNSIINGAMLSVISMMYMNEIRNIECTFKDISNTSLQSMNLHERNIIVTDVTRLTFIKIIQSFKINDFVVLDLKYIVNLPTTDFRSMNREVKKIKKETALIIVCDAQNSTSTLQRSLQDLARAVTDKNIIIITNKMFVDSVTKTFQKAKLTNDEGNSLLDLNEKSRTNIMQNTKTIFQGQEATLDLLIDAVSVAFVKGTVLNEVLSNETVYIGESLDFPIRPFDLLRYDPTELKYEIKDLYIDRRVSRNQSQSGHEFNVLQTLHDINDDVVLITAKPGIGKSTLLSYLSIKTKELDAKLWLVRINLLDYSKQFNKWKKDNTEIDILAVLKFMCQFLLKNKLKQHKKIKISLSNNNGEVYLKECTGDEKATFELEMFLHYFRKGSVIFLFDGFDEICPNYEDQVISFLNAVRGYRKHKIWVTSRPYNKIKHILQENFGILEPYELEPFSDIDQEIYFERFWKHNVALNELNEAQLQNLKGFLDFMVTRTNGVFVDNFNRVNKPQNYLLNKVYHHFMVYLQNELKILPMAFPLDWKHKDKLNYSLRTSARSQEMFRVHVGEEGIKDILEFVGTPLHLYLVADYFLSGIKDNRQKSNEWDLDINTYAIYENFLESKLKKIRFKDKNKMDIDNPDILETYEIVRKEFIEMHKKLAAYAIFETNGQKVFNKEDLEEIKYMMDKIKRGREKTGLIYNVSNDVPQFIHMTFTEYFAVEHISDLLKGEKNDEKQKHICDFIINIMLFESPLNVLNIMDQKLKMDTEFAAAIEKHSEHIFNILMYKIYAGIDDTKNIKSPLFEVISKNFNNFLFMFMSILEKNVNATNLDDFIRVIDKTGFLRTAIANRYEDLFLDVLKLIRNIDISKWRNFMSNTQYYSDDITTTFQLQRVLRQHYLSYFISSEVYRLESFMTNNEEA